jgi:hypothetical protein
MRRNETSMKHRLLWSTAPFLRQRSHGPSPASTFRCASRPASWKTRVG